ncbi:hypothetical protein BDK51DRAFT_36945 [Blyttiomyces helicus]|uniref:Uncharacterized protein n=1 Tax=Blyttiomyces helicus TaxID=388810 RepID=A0A4P9W7U6_9FUNG|nr:hypothetical protein BDK51DRAFT_36945 [Blyttiomyces helicus]|eukprot:RKO88454.1 hypothetical protein BDK51DRAFT_36945 [Blyttiomyces helicus]
MQLEVLSMGIPLACRRMDETRKKRSDRAIRITNPLQPSRQTPRRTLRCAGFSIESRAGPRQRGKLEGGIRRIAALVRCPPFALLFTHFHPAASDQRHWQAASGAHVDALLRKNKSSGGSHADEHHPPGTDSDKSLCTYSVLPSTQPPTSFRWFVDRGDNAASRSLPPDHPQLRTASPSFKASSSAPKYADWLCGHSPFFSGLISGLCCYAAVVPLKSVTPAATLTDALSPGAVAPHPPPPPERKPSAASNKELPMIFTSRSSPNSDEKLFSSAPPLHSAIASNFPIEKGGRGQLEERIGSEDHRRTPASLQKRHVNVSYASTTSPTLAGCR